MRETPFKVVYGRDPPSIRQYDGTARATAVDQLLNDRDLLLADVHERLLQAQQYYKRYYDNYNTVKPLLLRLRLTGNSHPTSTVPTRC